MFFGFYRHLIAPLSPWIFKILRPLLSEKLQALVQLREARPWKQNLLPKKAILIHASSGEIEYAKPVIKKLREKNPDQKIILTYFSPSTLKLVKNISVDALVPLPWDTPSEVRQFLNSLEPQALWISRTDLWPELLSECQKRNISTLLFSASFKTPENILSWSLKKWILGMIQEISFVSEKDLEDFQKFSKERAFQDGNTRVDQVVERLEEKRKLPLERFSTKPVIILGSLWPADVKIWLEVMESTEVRDRYQWIWVPHEVNAQEIIRLRDALLKHTRSVDIWTDVRLSKADHLIVNTVGFLAEIYTLGTLAFVGGSFASKVHSLLEPLAAGLPVLVGPFYRNQPEAESFSRLRLPNGIQAVTAFSSSAEIIAWLETLKIENHSSLILHRLAEDRGATDRLIQRHLAAPSANSSTQIKRSIITEG